MVVQTVYQLHTALNGYNSKIWRKVLVSPSMKLVASGLYVNDALWNGRVSLIRLLLPRQWWVLRSKKRLFRSWLWYKKRCFYFSQKSLRWCSQSTHRMINFIKKGMYIQVKLKTLHRHDISDRAWKIMTTGIAGGLPGPVRACYRQPFDGLWMTLFCNTISGYH